jgi:LacI family transcriptional regulator
VRWSALRDAAHALELKVARLGPYPPTLRGGEAAGDDVPGTAATAVMAYNDVMAIGLMRRLVELGLRVPRDVSVVGFDNIFGAELCSPSLTTVAAPHAALGAHAVRILLAGPPPDRGQPLRPARLPAELVERESTGPARRRRRQVAETHRDNS